MKLYFETIVSGSVKEVFFKFDKELFLQLKPPGVTVDLKRFDGCNKGDEIQLELKSPAGTQEWKGIVTDSFVSEDECYFVDEGVKLPFPLTLWSHRHTIKNIKGKTTIIDDISFEISPKIMTPVFYPILWSVFKYRGPIYRRIFK